MNKTVADSGFVGRSAACVTFALSSLINGRCSRAGGSGTTPKAACVQLACNY